MKDNLFLISGVGITLMLTTAVVAPVGFYFASNYLAPAKSKNDGFYVKVSLSNGSLHDSTGFLFDLKEDLNGFEIKSEVTQSPRHILFVPGVRRKNNNRTGDITTLRRSTPKDSGEVRNSPTNAKFSSAPSY